MKNINSGDFIAESPFKLTAAETHISTKLGKSEIKEELQQISEKLSAMQDIDIYKDLLAKEKI